MAQIIQLDIFIHRVFDQNRSSSFINRLDSIKEVIEWLEPSEVNIREIKTLPRPDGAEAAEMITTQNFLRVIAPPVVWPPGVNHKSDSQLGKQTSKLFSQKFSLSKSYSWVFRVVSYNWIVRTNSHPLYKHEDISLATLRHRPEGHKPSVAPRPLFPPLTSHFIRPRVTQGNRLTIGAIIESTKAFS